MRSGTMGKCVRAPGWRPGASARTAGSAVVDAILTGIHEPGTSHYQLLRAFVDDATLTLANQELCAHAYRTHEFGDFALIERTRRN